MARTKYKARSLVGRTKALSKWYGNYAFAHFQGPFQNRNLTNRKVTRHETARALKHERASKQGRMMLRKALQTSLHPRG